MEKRAARRRRERNHGNPQPGQPHWFDDPNLTAEAEAEQLSKYLCKLEKKRARGGPDADPEMARIQKYLLGVEKEKRRCTGCSI